MDKSLKWKRRGPFTKAMGISCVCPTTVVRCSVPRIGWAPVVSGPGNMSNPHLLCKVGGRMALPANSKMVKVIPPGGTAPGTRASGRSRNAMKYRLLGGGKLMKKVGNLTRAKVPGTKLDHQTGGSHLHPARKAGSGTSAIISGENHCDDRSLITYSSE